MMGDKEADKYNAIGKMKPKRYNWNCEVFLKSILIFLVILLVACLIAMLCLALVKRYVVDEDAICHNEGCKSTAFALISGMDWSVDPCNDFYSYTCADFIRKSSSSYEEISTSFLHDFAENYKRQFELLLDDNDLDNQPKIFSTVQEMYNICVNSSSSDSKNEFGLFKYFLDNVLDGWPMEYGNDWLPSRANLGEHLGTIMSYDFETGLITLYGEPDSEDPSKYQLQIKLGLITTLNEDEESVFSTRHKSTDKDGRQQKRNRRSLINFLTKLLKLFDDNNKYPFEDYEKLNELDSYMETLITENLETNDSISSEKMTINELNSLTDDKIDWLKLINKNFDGIQVFKGADTVNVHSPEMMKNLPDILDLYPRRTIQNALSWNVIFPEIIVHAGDEALNLFNDFKSEIDDGYQPKDRIAVCQSWVNKVFSDVITRSFVDKYIDKQSKSTIEEMIQFIQDAYLENIETDQWMSETTKDDASKIIKEMLKFIAYDEEIFNNEVLDNKYSDIIIMPNHFSNFIQMNSHLNRRQMKLFTEPVNKTRYSDEFYRQELTTFSDPVSTGLMISARILQIPYFDDKRLAALNFGTLGALIASQLAREVETEGVLFPYLGHYEEFRENDTLNLLNNRSICLIDQYSDYCIQDPKDNETNHCLYGYNIYHDILTENVGLKIAHDAYELWVAKHGEEKRVMELLEFSPEQIFFLSYANFRCEYLTNDQELSSFKDNELTGRVSINGAITNNEAFREIFNCQDASMEDGDEGCTIH